MIELNNDYRIKSDKYCWILEIRSDGKTSKGEHKDVWTPHYYPSFQKISDRIVQEQAKYADSLDEIVEIMEKTSKEIAEMIHKVGG